MKPLALALLLAGFALPAGDPTGFYLWKSAELKGFSKTLAPKMNDKKFATQSARQLTATTLSMWPTAKPRAKPSITRRRPTFSLSKAAKPRSWWAVNCRRQDPAPNEMRAASIKGGTEKKLAAGDVVTIPAKTAHQLKLDAGKQFTYFYVKVTQP